MEELAQLLAAQQAAYFALIKALHENGVLPVDAVVSRFEKSQDFAAAAFGKAKNAQSTALLDHLKALADAYRQSQPPR